MHYNQIRLLSVVLSSERTHSTKKIKHRSSIIRTLWLLLPIHKSALKCKKLNMIEVSDQQSHYSIPEDPSCVALFPTCLKVGMKLANCGDVISVLETECLNRTLPSFRDLFTVRYIPQDTEKWEVMLIKCKRCMAGAHIVPDKRKGEENGKVRVKRMLSEHDHHLDLTENAQIEIQGNFVEPKEKGKSHKKKDFEDYKCKQSPKKQPKKQKIPQNSEQRKGKPKQPNINNGEKEFHSEPRKTQPAKQTQKPKLSKVNQKAAHSTLDNFTQAQKLMFQNEVQFVIDWGNMINDKYPEFMIFATPKMIDNYRKFGETISFDITNDIVSNTAANDEKYRLGTFVVQDSSLKPKLGAVALFCIQQVSLFYRLFEAFFKLYGVAPSSIMTDENIKINKAMGLIRSKKIFKGSHLYDAWHILANLSKTILGDKESQARVFNGIAKLIKIRDQDQYKETAQKLVEKSGINRQFTEVFLEKADRVCFFKVPPIFIGIDNWKSSKISDLLETSQTNISIYRLIQILIKNSRGNIDPPFKVYSQKAEEYLQDKRFKEVRQRVHQKVFMRLMENYITSLTSYQILEKVKDDQTNTMAFIVKRIKSDATYDVIDWKCTCNQMEKSGVACPHVLICAKDVKEKSLLDFIAKRWIQQPGRQQNGGLKGSHSNKQSNSLIEIQRI